MHYQARKFTAPLSQELQASNNHILFGETLKYNKIFLCKLEFDEYVTVEELVEGSFDKHITNNGHIYGFTNNKFECLAHYSFEWSNKEVMVVDIQGCDHFLFDPPVWWLTVLIRKNSQNVKIK